MDLSKWFSDYMQLKLDFESMQSTLRFHVKQLDDLRDQLRESINVRQDRPKASSLPIARPRKAQADLGQGDKRPDHRARKPVSDSGSSQ